MKHLLFAVVMFLAGCATVPAPTVEWTSLALMGIDQDAQTLRFDREMGYRSDGVIVWRGR